MTISKLNIAVLTQFAGLILLGFSQNDIGRIAGIVVIIVGGVQYRREQKRRNSSPQLSSEDTAP